MDTRNRIIAAGIKLFSQYGYHNVSVNQIADEVGIRGGSIYNHFDSKEALLDCIIQRMEAFLRNCAPNNRELLAQLDKGSLQDVLLDFISYYMDEDDTLRQAYYRILYMGMYDNERLLGITYRFLVKAPVDSLVQALDYLVSQGLIPPCDSTAIAELWNRTSLVYGYQAAHEGFSVVLDQFRQMNKFYVEMIIRGVRHIPVENMELQWQQRRPFPYFEEVEAGTRGQILLQALNLFSEHGYGSVTMRQIAAAAGIKAGSIYNHFSGKQEIMRTLTENFLVGFEQYRPDNPTFQTIMKSRDEGKLVISLSNFYLPIDRPLIYKIYRVLFREQYLDVHLKELFLETIRKDISTIKHTLDSLVKQDRVRLCVPSWKIATAYVHTMCSLTIGATVDKPVPEEHLYPQTVAPLVSLILYGFLDAKPVDFN